MTSKSIYGQFKPTYLYIKRHSITGKLYFGKTVQNPEKYLGSGLHWRAHIKKHGVDKVETLWYCLFLDEESCTEFALNFSKQHNIVESEDWLNLIPENGMHSGNPKGIRYSNDRNTKISNSLRGTKHSNEHNQRIAISRTGSQRQQTVISCPHCKISGGSNTMKRWHFDNCKNFIPGRSRILSSETSSPSSWCLRTAQLR